MNSTRFISFIFILCAAACVVGQQSSPSPLASSENHVTLSPQEKGALIDLAKRFSHDMQRTRDVAPLIPRYFYPNVTYWWSLIPGGPALYTKPTDQQPSTSGLREYRSETNMIYLLNLSGAIGDDDKFGGKLPNLFQNYPEDQSQKAFPAALRKWEQEYARSLPFLRRKNFERTARYKQYLEKSECNYKVSESQLASQDDKMPAAFQTRFPDTTRLYGVQTPIGLTLMFVRYGHTFKIFFSGPCPWD